MCGVWTNTSGSSEWPFDVYSFYFSLQHPFFSESKYSVCELDSVDFVLALLVYERKCLFFQFEPSWIRPNWNNRVNGSGPAPAYVNVYMIYLFIIGTAMPHSQHAVNSKNGSTIFVCIKYFSVFFSGKVFVSACIHTRMYVCFMTRPSDLAAFR